MADDAPLTRTQRMFAIEARMLRAARGNRAEFDEHSVDDVQWLLRLANEMFSLLPDDVKDPFRTTPDG